MQFLDSLLAGSHLRIALSICYHFDFDSYILVMNRENSSFTWSDFNTKVNPSWSIFDPLASCIERCFCRAPTTIYSSCILLGVLYAWIVLSPDHTVVWSFRFILQLSSSRKHSDFSSETPSWSSSIFWCVSQHFLMGVNRLCILHFRSDFLLAF